MERRSFIKLLSTAGVGILASGLLAPARLFAAIWPKKAFQTDKVAVALKELYGNSDTKQSDQITIKASRKFETGNSIPITISTELEKVRSISIIIANNDPVLAASFLIPEGTRPYISTRVKLARTSNIVAVVESVDGLYSNLKRVKVTHGFCIEGIE